MTLRDLREKVAALSHLHPLTPVGADDLRHDAGCIVADCGESDAEFDLREARDNEKQLADELKEAEAERDEWQRRAETAEELLETSPADGPGLLRDALEDVERFRATAIDWAKTHALMQKELTALRKRKGVEAGVCAYSHEVRTLLYYVSQLEGRYQREARELHEKISLIP